jgi:hypothetical protein
LCASPCGAVRAAWRYAMVGGNVPSESGTFEPHEFCATPKKQEQHDAGCSLCQSLARPGGIKGGGVCACQGQSRHLQQDFLPRCRGGDSNR